MTTVKQIGQILNTANKLLYLWLGDTIRLWLSITTSMISVSFSHHLDPISLVGTRQNKTFVL